MLGRKPREILCLRPVGDPGPTGTARPGAPTSPVSVRLGKKILLLQSLRLNERNTRDESPAEGG